MSDQSSKTLPPLSTPLGKMALTADLFVSAPIKHGEAEIISRPTLTYWQDAFSRIRKDKMALSCLALILAILAIGLFVPFFFPAETSGVPYFNLQNPNDIDQSPTMGEKMMVVDDVALVPTDVMAEGLNLNAPLLAPDKLVPPTSVKIVGVGTVSGITLVWNAVEGVSGYQIYRTTKSKDFNEDELRSGAIERGIMVGELTGPGLISYTDAMGLDSSESYAYSITTYVDVPGESEKAVSTAAAIVTTALEKTISISDAQLIHPSAQVGQEIKGRAHPFGTDGLGRDVLSRMIKGTQVDMLLALFVPLVSIMVGLIYGSISGLLGKKTDLVMMRIVEIVDNFPDLLFFILLQVAIGKGLFSLFVAMTLFWWAGFARIVRGEVLRLREIEFVQASRLLGAPLMRIVTKHVGPNLLGLVIIAWSARIPSVIAFETFLSMLGLGLEQPNPSWGNVVFDAARRLQVNPIQFFLPAAVLGSTLLAFYLLGNSLRDAFDPNLRGRG